MRPVPQDCAGAACAPLADRLFEGILSVLALTPALHAEVATDLELLAQATERDGVQSLYDDYTRGLLAKLQTGCDAWTKHSFERRLFEVILARAGTALGALLDDLMVIFVANVKVQRDVEQRARCERYLRGVVTDARWAQAARRTAHPHCGFVLCLTGLLSLRLSRADMNRSSQLLHPSCAAALGRQGIPRLAREAGWFQRQIGTACFPAGLFPGVGLIVLLRGRNSRPLSFHVTILPAASRCHATKRHLGSR